MQTNSLRHPPSLKIFFSTEMWERYGFYVVQTLLALYLAFHFYWDDEHIYPLVGAFTALTYLSPVVGGWIADHLLGQKRSVLIGTVVLFFSYLALSSIITEEGLTFALAGIAVGTGLLKPNISSLLGNEYAVGSPKRERGFTIFYMGITTGIILGTTLPSYIQTYYGWPQAFLSAALGMIFAMFIFSYGIRQYQIADYSNHRYDFKKILSAFLLILLMWVGSYYILHQTTLAQTAFTLIAILSVFYLYKTIKKDSGTQAKQTLTIGLLCIISIIFWSFYFQMFLSLTLFLSRVAQPTLWGIPFPPPYYVAIQSFGMIIFGLFLAHQKTQLTPSEHAIRVGHKFLLSMICMCFAYASILIICLGTQHLGLISPLLFIPAYLLISLAELLLSPIGLSAITVLSSPDKVSTMMGIFFVSLGIGGFLSGKLANVTALSKDQLELLSIVELKAHYASSFSILFLILLSGTVLSALITLYIRYLLKNKNR